MLDIFIFLIIGLALPFVLWPIELFLPFPYIVEELAKFLCMAWLKKARFFWVTLFALFFSVSEGVLYLMNYFALGSLRDLPFRLTVTTLMHVTTTLIIFSAIHEKWPYRAVSLVIAMLFHFVFNSKLGFD